MNNLLRKLLPSTRRRSSSTGRRRIVFVCAPDVIPYTVVQYLESLGVKATPQSKVHIESGGTRTATVHVAATQHTWAASLVAGMAPGSIVVIEPVGAKPVAPRTAWGKPSRTNGIVALILRGAASYFGVDTKTPPVKGRR